MYLKHATDHLTLGSDWTVYYLCLDPSSDAAAPERQALARVLSKMHHAEAFPGMISVQYLADPDPVATWLLQAETVHLFLLVHREDRVAGFATCLERTSLVNGDIGRVGYLASLKLLPSYRKRFRFMAKVYHWLHQCTRSRIDLYYTTILSENRDAIQLLTKVRASMPIYQHQGRYRVYAMKPKRGPQEPLGTDVPGSLAWLSADGEPSPHAILDLRGSKQYHLHSYGGMLRWMRHLPTQWLGYPAFPKPGQDIEWIAGHLRLTPQTSESEARARLRTLRAHAHDLGGELLLIGAMVGTPTADFLDRFKAVRYTSELYTIDWDHQGLPPLEDVDLPVFVL